MKTPNVFTIEMKVPQSAIDALGHVNNVIYLEWVQEVSRKHWESRVPQKMREQYYWVVLHHFIYYKHPAFAEDILLLKTWVDHFNGAKSERHVEIRRKSDKSLIVKAETSWCLVDAAKKSPKRIAPEVEALFFE